MQQEIHSFREFQSVTALHQYLLDTPRVKAGLIRGGDYDNQNPRGPLNESFSGDMDWNAAMDCARRGGNWEAGGKDLRQIEVAMTNMRRHDEMPELELDVAGFLPDVGVYLSGDPCCMLNESEDESGRNKIIKIGVHMGSSGTVKADAKMNRGAAIMSCLDSLEQAGYSIELWAVWASAKSQSKQSVDYRVQVKLAGSAWNPASVAFMVAHPAAHRRLMWGVTETEPTHAEFRSTMGYGYTPEGFDVFFPWVAHTETQWRTREGALKSVTQHINKQLSEAKDDE